jgi:hypothetical protein
MNETTETGLKAFGELMDIPSDRNISLPERNIKFFFYLNTKKASKADISLELIKSSLKGLEFEEKEELVSSLGRGLKSLDIGCINAKDAKEKTAFFEKIRDCSNLPTSFNLMKEIFVVVAGDNGDVSELIQEMRVSQLDLDKIAFGVMPIGTFNDLAYSTKFGSLKKTMKKIGKLNNKEKVKSEIKEIIKEYLNAEMKQLDVWAVEIECHKGGGIKKVVNERGVNRLESLMELNDLAKRKEIMVRTRAKGRKKSQFLICNQLVEKSEEVRRRSSKIQLDDSSCSEEEETLNKLKKIYSKKNQKKSLKMKKLMTCFCSLGDDANIGLEYLLKDKKHRAKKKRTFIKKNFKKLFSKQTRPIPLNKMISKFEIFRGLEEDRDSFINKDSIFEQARHEERVTLEQQFEGITELAELYRERLLEEDEQEEEDEERRNVSHWHLLTRTVFVTDKAQVENRNTLMNKPINLLFQNIPNYLGNKSGFWNKVSKKSGIKNMATHQKNRIKVEGKEQDFGDGNLEVISFKRDMCQQGAFGKLFWGKKAQRISQSKIQFKPIRQRTIPY